MMDRKRVRLLVVGGSGFIGGSIVKHAVKLGWDVTNLSLRPRRGLGYHDEVRHLSVDITNTDRLRDVLGGMSFEYVVNCGGYIDHSPFCNGGRTMIQSHFYGIQNLVECLNRENLIRFVQIGSSDEYGNAPAAQKEDMRESPISPYSLAKVAVTHFLQMLSRTEEFPAVTLRLFLTYGPGQDVKRFLPQVVRGCLAGVPFPTSDGRQLRDFCFISDTVDAVFSTFENPRSCGEVINIGSGKPIAIRQMIEHVQCVIGHGAPQFGKFSYRPGENMALYADISKAKDILDWEPKTTLDIGLDKTIEWVKEHM